MNEFGTDVNVGNITNSCAHENDLISRQWLMECINEGWIKFDTEKDENKFIHLVRDIAPPAQPYTAEEIQKMQELESAQLEKAYELGVKSTQPEREKGTWTNDASCPFCGFQPWYERDINTLSFCPNCGADMRGEQG